MFFEATYKRDIDSLGRSQVLGAETRIKPEGAGGANAHFGLFYINTEKLAIIWVHHERQTGEW